MYLVNDIANWFLVNNHFEMSEGITDECITNLKLQKLLYYAQGSYLVLKDEKLFNEDILAWAHGPVVKTIYDKYKVAGSGCLVHDSDFDMDNIDSETKDILNTVYKNFGQYSAWKLRDMTHEKGSPWDETNRNEVIDIGLIKKYFEEKYVEES